MPSQIVEVPLRTSQVATAHPFFVGSGGQTYRSKNLWADDVGRMRRRPALHIVGDHRVYAAITGMFSYKFQSRSSRATNILVVHFDNLARDLGAFTRPTSIRLVGCPCEFGLPASTGYGTRGIFRAWPAVNIWNSPFLFGEEVQVYTNPAGNPNGGVYNCGGQVLAENIDYVTGYGTLVIRVSGSGFSDDGLIYGRILTQWGARVYGLTSTANVEFAPYSFGSSPEMQMIWQADSLTDWAPRSVPSFEQYGRLLFIQDSSYDYPLRMWSGGASNATEILDAPSSSYMTVHQNRIWVAGIEDEPSMIVGCGYDVNGFANPFDWDYENIRDDGAIRLFINADDQDSITGLTRSYYGDLYIWKRKSLHRISGQIFNDTFSAQATPYTFQTVSRGIGCASHHTIQHVGNDIFWMSDKGVHSLSVTERYGDVQESYISFPINDFWERMPPDRLRECQAVYFERLGLYILAVAVDSSQWLNKLLVYSVAQKMWRVWDIGNFTSISLGPGRCGDSESVYVGLVYGPIPTPGYVYSNLGVLDFRDETDWEQEWFSADFDNRLLGTSTPIECHIEPGDIFSTPSEIRYPKKSVSRAQFYIAPRGSYTSTLKYSWDSGEEKETTIDLNPNREWTLGNGFVLGGSDHHLQSRLGSINDSSTTSVRIAGNGHLLRMRIEDSNFGRLPYLHADLKVDIGDEDYSPAQRR